MPRKGASTSQASTSRGGTSRAPKQKTTRRIVSSEEEGSDSDYGNSRLETSQNKYARIASRDPDTKMLTNNMVKYLLNLSANKHMIKRADITKSVNLTPKNFPEILEACKQQLKDVYGLEVAEVGEKSAKGFIIFGSRSYGCTGLQYQPEHRAEITLLMIVLAYIFMKNGEVQDAHLFSFLEQIKISTNEPDNHFGDVGKLIREKFVRQLYLKRNKEEIEGINELQIHLLWGARAEKEFDKKEVLAVVARIMGKSPANFISQHHEANSMVEEEDFVIIE